MINIGDSLSLCNCLLRSKIVMHPTKTNKKGDKCIYCNFYVLKRKADEKDANTFNKKEFRETLDSLKWMRLIQVLKEQENVNKRDK